jgi:hypothetical protein
MNTGGKSVRLDVAISPELYAQVQRYRKRHKVAGDSEVVRLALAELVGKPQLGVGMRRGRPRAP